MSMEKRVTFLPNPKLRLMEQVREVLRYHHYSLRTEQTYCSWILRFIRFFECKLHPRVLGVSEIERFLSALATRDRVSASTQRQALNALVFLYREVLGISWDRKISPIRASTAQRPPTVLSRSEVKSLLHRMDGTHRIMAELLYGAGLRLMECVRLRVKDLDFSQKRLLVRAGKGKKDRSTVLPLPLIPKLQAQIDRVRELHELDLKVGLGGSLPTRWFGSKVPKGWKGIDVAICFPIQRGVD